MEKILKKVMKVRFQDCDPFNHLNNSRYIDYFINAREDQILEHYNIDVYDYLKATANAWLVVSNQISYLKPALVNENVLIESKLIEHSKKSVAVEMLMWDEKQTHLKAIFWTRFVHFNVKTKQTVEHSSELNELFEKVVVHNENSSFEERCKQIISDNQYNQEFLK